jgi:hypothetical protein
MPEHNETTVRQLPAGDPRRAREIARKGRSIEIELLEEASDLTTGKLVEISSEENIYLGELRTRQGLRLTVTLEHAVDRAKIMAIQALWKQG